MAESVQTGDKSAQLGEKSIVRLMVQYSTPAIAAMFVLSAYNMINMWFIGRSVGQIGIAAIAVCQPIIMIHGAISQFICNGCVAAVSIKLGEGDREGARELLGNTVACTVILTFALALVARMFSDAILGAFGASDTVLPYARDYFNIIMFSNVFIGAMNLNPIMRIEGYPALTMITILLGTTVNLIIAPTLIFVFGLGIRGAAISTLCAQLATAIWMTLFISNKKRIIRLQVRYFRIKLSNLRRITSLGLPTFIMQLTQNLLSIILNKTLGVYGGDVAISAWGITNNINSIIALPIYGLNQGAQPIIGYNIGAKNYLRVRKSLIYSLAAASGFAFLGWILPLIFPSQLFAFFNADQELMSVGVQMITVFRILAFVVGFQQAGTSYFQYSGKPGVSILLSLSRHFFIMIPCVLVLPKFFGFIGILYSGPVSDGVSVVVTAIFIIIEFRRLRKLAVVS